MTAFLHRHYLLTTALAVWWLLVAPTWVVWRVFGEAPPNIPMGTATAFGAVFGLLPAVIGLWKWRQEVRDAA